MFNGYSIERLSQVHPKLAGLAREMDAQLEPHGIEIQVIQGLRTWAQQEALWNQGRTTPGAIVTDAPPGDSYHNFGTAIDVVPGLRGVESWQPNWDPDSPDFVELIKVGIGLGLVSGSIWKLKDYPHFQLGDGLPVSPTEEMRECLEKNGMEEFWQQYLK